ncbi:MAG: VCBS repeat-containing protein, partial [Chitinophagaceae bacterium]|nr:VCBS repeat-containing protein [Chitinophagaceae bacterium]
VTDSLGVSYTQKEIDHIDFNVQKLLPHKFSEYGPALAVGDIDGNGLEDIIAGGSYSYSTTLLLQQKNGSFKEKPLIPQANNNTKGWEDMGIVLFDADNDEDLDIYIASGGYESKPGSEAYKDKLFINDGKGNFDINSNALPQNFTSKSCVRAADFDRDGDLDLFVAGRVDPWNYPKPVSSYIFRNDTKDGKIKFTDVSDIVAKSLNSIGLVCDAVWTDFNSDGWQDLILTGEWMALRFLKNNNGIFNDITSTTGIDNKHGWWTSIVPGDFDNDGDIDYVAGNLGLNSFYRTGDKDTVKIYAKDYDNNGNYDAIPTLFLPTSQEDLSKKEYPAQTRDDMAKQMIMFRSKFQNYRTYASATFDKMLSKDELKDALVLKANYFANSLIKNLGNGKFQIIPLPLATQYSCINGMLCDDFDGDGNLDLLINGNDYGTEVSVGRYDACNGLFLKGNGNGNFSPLSILQSGWYVPGNGKALVKLQNAAGETLVAASQNKGPLKIFQFKRKSKVVSLGPADVSAIVKYKDGHQQKREINYGASFLSQSGRFLNIGSNVVSIQIMDNNGKIRNIEPN